MDYPKSDPGSQLSNDKFTDGDPSQGIPPSIDKAAHQNLLYDELINLITSVGLVPDELNPTQLSQALSIAAPYSQITFHYVDLNAPDPVPGWRICDGTNGTPDMRNRFVLMSDQDAAMGTTGGRVTASTANGGVTVNGATLAESQGAIHTHGLNGQLVGGSGDTEGGSGRFNSGGTQDTASTRIQNSAGGSSHTHSASVDVTPSFFVLAPFIRADYADYLIANGGV